MKIEKWMIKEDFDPRWNVLYFGDKFDFRLIPKNCSTTAKVMWSQMNGYNCNDKRSQGNPHGIIPNDEATTGKRKKRVLENGRLFRPGTKLVAVKRDPVERWVSAINFCIIMHSKGYEHADYVMYNDLPWIHWDINMIAAYQLAHGFMVSELLPQSYCAGGIEKYDYVYTTETFEDFYLLLEQEFDIILPRVVTTKTKGIGKWSVDDLNEDALAIIKHIYAQDYELGWTL
jgi:hypothetical protein